MGPTPGPGLAPGAAKTIAGAVVIGLLASGVMVWHASSAAFTGQTINDGNSWDSGKVVLSDNVPGTAWFNELDQVPGPGTGRGNKCVEVEYDGDVPSTVKVYGNNPTGTLDLYLDLDIEIGSGATCAAPGTYTQIFGDVGIGPAAGVDTLDEFAANHFDYATGVGAIAPWQPSTPDSVRPYRFSWTLGDDNNAQNKSATNVTFTWEVQNN